MTNFTLIFVVALAVNVALTTLSSDWFKRFQRSQQNTSTLDLDDGETETKKRWHALLRKYLIVYLLAALSDWLQGPYVYALYAAYGYSQHDIAVLFVAGFGSSMVFGSFVGGMADWGGRRAFCLLFAVIYAASCFTKRTFFCFLFGIMKYRLQFFLLIYPFFYIIYADFKSFGILMVGRLLGGIATSLLFSIFEAWLIRAHADANLKHMLGKSFSWASYGNSVVAIFAGLVANRAANQFPMIEISSGFVYAGGYLNPFDIAMVALILCGFFAATLWNENYGESEKNSDGAATGKWYDGLRSALTTTMAQPEVYLCGMISSLFEGSMYIFVFMWTPALTSKADSTELPFGLIFSTFMVCCMAGSSMFSMQVEQYKCEQLGVIVFAVAAASMGLVVLSSSVTLKFIAMNLFEMTVGMYFPIMGTLKGHIVPENKRAAIYNLFRIPLNFIVLFSLLTDLTPQQSFALNTAMLSTATGLMYVLMKRREVVSHSKDTDTETQGDEEEELSSLEAEQSQKAPLLKEV
jgi:MFS transporter, MFS domain-containing protein family, molybdate-anion transporter